MSTPFRKVRVPNRGCTWAPNGTTIRPSAGHGSRPRRLPNPTPGGSIPPFGGGTLASLRCLAVDLRLLGLGFGVQSRQLLLAPLFATLAIGEPFRCPTILSNQTSVQHRQAREV